MQEAWVRSLDQDDALEKEMATHSSILSGTIPWTGEPGRLQSMRSQRVGHDLVTKHGIPGTWLNACHCVSIDILLRHRRAVYLIQSSD